MRSLVLILAIAILAFVTVQASSSSRRPHEIDPVIVPASTNITRDNPYKSVVIIDGSGSWSRVPKVNTTRFSVKPKINKRNFVHDPILAQDYAAQAAKRAAKQAKRSSKRAAQKAKQEAAEKARLAAKNARKAARKAKRQARQSRYRKHSHQRK